MIVAVAAAHGRFGDGLFGGDHIARVDIKGVIVHDDHRLKKISDIAGNDDVKAAMIRIDSPAGTVVGGETLHKAFIDLAATKPVVAVMGGIGTSAAYMTAIAADRIYVREGTFTGSIGVLLQTTEVTRLLEMIGVAASRVKPPPGETVFRWLGLYRSSGPGRGAGRRNWGRRCCCQLARNDTGRAERT